MLAWLIENLGTIMISLVLIGIVTAVIAGMIHDKKNGRNNCGCDCEHCAMHGKCHNK